MVAKCGLFDSKLPHNNPAVLLFYPWKMSIPTGAVWCCCCCSYKQVFSEGEFGLVWLAEPPPYRKKKKEKKKPPNKMDFSFVPKEEKNKKLKIKN